MLPAALVSVAMTPRQKECDNVTHISKLPIRFAQRLALAGLSLSVMSGLAAAQEAEKPVSFTQAQADRGARDYRARCLDCHGENLNDGEFGGAPLKGNDFESKWFDSSADSIFSFMVNAMPPDSPGSLSEGKYADILAYILSRNGLEAGASELPSDEEALGKLIIKR